MLSYKTFLTFFIIAILAMIVFVVLYIQTIFGFAISVSEANTGPEPGLLQAISAIFTPAVVIAGLVLAISNLTYRIIGIVAVTKNKLIGDGEKALWIIGFVIMGFITAIVFLAMAKSKKFVA